MKERVLLSKVDKTDLHRDRKKIEQCGKYQMESK